jgi:hypothetical protein
MKNRLKLSEIGIAAFVISCLGLGAMFYGQSQYDDGYRVGKAKALLENAKDAQR